MCISFVGTQQCRVAVRRHPAAGFSLSSSAALPLRTLSRPRNRYVEQLVRTRCWCTLDDDPTAEARIVGCRCLPTTWLSTPCDLKAIALIAQPSLGSASAAVHTCHRSFYHRSHRSRPCPPFRRRCVLSICSQHAQHPDSPHDHPPAPRRATRARPWPPWRCVHRLTSDEPPAPPSDGPQAALASPSPYPFPAAVAATQQHVAACLLPSTCAAACHPRASPWLRGLVRPPPIPSGCPLGALLSLCPSPLSLFSVSADQHVMPLSALCPAVRDSPYPSSWICARLQPGRRSTPLLCARAS